MPQNPNCEASEEFVFKELGPVKPVAAIRVGEGRQETLCDVAGVEKDSFFQAFAVKIADSGAGFAYLIYGGAWGLRLRPEASRGQAWDLGDRSQWGEPFKIYGEEKDIVYGASQTNERKGTHA